MATTRTGRTSPPLLDARSWTEAEDDAVRAAVASHGKRAWTDVARDVSDAFPGRPKTSKQCRARWVASLDPKITTRPWTEAEERIIRESQAEVGNKWATIAKRYLSPRPRRATRPSKTTPFRGSSRPSAPRGRSPVFAPPRPLCAGYRAEPTTRSRTTGAVPARGHSSFFGGNAGFRKPRSGRGAGAGASVDSDRNDGFRVLRGRGVAGPLRGTSTARRRRIAGRRMSRGGDGITDAAKRRPDQETTPSPRAQVLPEAQGRARQEVGAGEAPRGAARGAAPRGRARPRPRRRPRAVLGRLERDDAPRLAPQRPGAPRRPRGAFASNGADRVVARRGRDGRPRNRPAPPRPRRRRRPTSRPRPRRRCSPRSSRRGRSRT